MGIEDGRKGEQGPLFQATQDLETKNQEFHGMLFAKFGSNRGKALVFPTPLVYSSDGVINCSQFLVVTSIGYKAIDVSEKRGDKSSVNKVKNLIEARLGKKPGFFSGVGYRSGSDGSSLHLGGSSIIGQSETTTFYSDVPHDVNVKLVDIDGDRVEEILKKNIERVQKMQETSQKVSGVLKTS